MARSPVSSKVRLCASLLLLALVACSQDRNRGGARILGQCQDGASQACACTDGRSGAQVCMNDTFSACDCSGNTGDASSSDGAMMSFDIGAWDGGVGFDGPIPDFGFADSGFDTGVPFDSGSPDFDTGVTDNGFPPFDAGFFDSGAPDTGPFDSGFRPDAAPPFDGGPPFGDGGSGGDAGPIPCVDDTQCAAPLTICDGTYCVDGCVFGTACPMGETCSILTGRCGSGPGGLCLTDDMCAPPASICEIPFCAEGCTIAGCMSGLSCNPLTGRCQ